MPPNYGACNSNEDIMGTFTHSVSQEYIMPLLSKKGKKYWIPKRYLFSFLSFTACCLAVSYNMNLSIAIVPMVNQSDVVFKHGSILVLKNGTSMASIFTAMMPQWNADLEGVALGAVYYGQLISFIPGGRMAELYGGKRMLLICTLIGAIFTAILPLVARWSQYAFIVGRFIIGIGTGPIIPIVFYMLARWIPLNERSFHASFILSGYGVGSFICVIVAGLLCGSGFLGGWPSVFYTGGISGILWCLVASYIMCETPESHTTISKKELAYIVTRLETGKRQKIMKIPWSKMALSIPLWALAIGFFGQFWLLGFFSTVHALYMGTVLNIPIAQTGILSCLPHLLRAIATCAASYPVDVALERKWVSVAFVRKGATIINTVVSCGAFLGITLVGYDITATTILFIVGGVLGEFVTFGVCMACIDIAPCLSGTVSGIINIVGVFPFFIIPALVGWLTNYESSMANWHKVFYVSIAVVCVSTLVFVIFGDLNPQPWGTIREKQSRREETEETKNYA